MVKLLWGLVVATGDGSTGSTKYTGTTAFISCRITNSMAFCLVHSEDGLYLTTSDSDFDRFFVGFRKPKVVKLFPFLGLLNLVRAKPLDLPLLRQASPPLP